jgi:ParB family chromosome partitioning protein
MTKRKEISKYFENNNKILKSKVSQDIDNNKTYSKYHLYDSPDLSSSTVLDIDPKHIVNWKFHDRPEDELGDIQSLADDMKNIGQQQPCIVRPIYSSNIQKYEIIAGERRWRAALLAQINLKVIVKNLDDFSAALVQIAENENRKNLSDFAKAKSLQSLIDNNILNQNDLVFKLHKSKQYISALLSYNKIPDKVYNAIGNFSKVSASLAEKIKQLCTKGEAYEEAIIELKNKIVEGKIGKSNLEKAVLKKVQDVVVYTKKIYSNDGIHLFSLHYHNNIVSDIHFTKNSKEKLKIIQNNETKLIKSIKELLEIY